MLEHQVLKGLAVELDVGPVLQSGKPRGLHLDGDEPGAVSRLFLRKIHLLDHRKQLFPVELGRLQVEIRPEAEAGEILVEIVVGGNEHQKVDAPFFAEGPAVADDLPHVALPAIVRMGGGSEEVICSIALVADPERRLHEIGAGDGFAVFPVNDRAVGFSDERLDVSDHGSRGPERQGPQFGQSFKVCPGSQPGTGEDRFHVQPPFQLRVLFCIGQRVASAYTSAAMASMVRGSSPSQQRTTDQFQRSAV